VGALHDEQRKDQAERSAHEVADEQNTLTGPPIKEWPDERPDDCKGEEQDGEGAGDGARRRHVLWRKEVEGGKTNLKHSVTALGDEADGEKSLKSAVMQESAEIRDDGH